MNIKDKIADTLKKFCNQRMKHLIAVYNLKAKKRQIDSKRDGNFHFEREGDQALTIEQKEEISKYWAKYRFAYEADPSMAQTYYNRSGIFSPLYIPYDLKKIILVPSVVPKRLEGIQGKAFLPKQILHGKLPAMVLAAYNGIYYDDKYNVLTEEQATMRIAEEQEEIVVKPTLVTSGGQGISFYKNPGIEDAKKILKKMKGYLVIQRAVKQHPVLNQFNESTVNTVRVTSFRRANNEVVILATLLKVGGGTVRVDNYKKGGCLVGIKRNGELFDWALASDYSRTQVLPSGIDLSESTYEIPGYSELLKMVKNVHLTMPQIRVISWDIAIDETATPVIIEINFNGDWRMHQILTGPLFGEYTDEFLEEFLLQKYSLTDSVKAYDIEEFHDHIEILNYYGTRKHVSVPKMIKGKPVTKICNKAFSKCETIKSVEIPETVVHLGVKAFLDCENLESFTFNGRLKFCGKGLFWGCKNLKNVAVSEKMRDKYSVFAQYVDK